MFWRAVFAFGMLCVAMAGRNPDAALPNQPRQGQGQLGGNLDVLTPLQGVDFQPYFMRMLGTMKKNWYANIPDAARRGKKGKVVIYFRISRDGKISEPTVVSHSGGRPLAKAAKAAIQLSNPLDPFPEAFKGPYIDIRITFRYNLPLDESSRRESSPPN